MKTDSFFRELIDKFSLYYDQDEQKSSVDKILREIRWTDFLQSLVDFANENALRNFQLQLVMQEDGSYGGLTI